MIKCNHFIDKSQENYQLIKKKNSNVYTHKQTTPKVPAGKKA